MNISLAHLKQSQDPANPNQALLAGEQKTKGVELSLTGQLTDQLSVLAGYICLLEKNVMVVLDKIFTNK